MFLPVTQSYKSLPGRKTDTSSLAPGIWLQALHWNSIHWIFSLRFSLGANKAKTQEANWRAFHKQWQRTSPVNTVSGNFYCPDLVLEIRFFLWHLLGCNSGWSEFFSFCPISEVCSWDFPIICGIIHYPCNKIPFLPILPKVCLYYLQPRTLTNECVSIFCSLLMTKEVLGHWIELNWKVYCQILKAVSLTLLYLIFYIMDQYDFFCCGFQYLFVLQFVNVRKHSNL